MDREKLQKIFLNEAYQLPIFWDGKDFYATLYKHLKGYREDIEKNYGYDSDLCAKVKSICQGICAAVDCSFRGYPEKAYKSFESVMDILKEDPLLIDEQKIKNEKLYRVVDVGNVDKPSRKRLFHVPFSLRSKMSTQRYSIPGFPCLYLGTSVELCCAELEKDPKLDYLYVSRYELQTDPHTLDRLFGDSEEKRQKPVFDNDKFKVFDISIKPDEAANTMQNKDFAKYTKWYPLIAACSYVRAMRNSNYSAEHIIPQLFIQWLRSEYEEAVVGIKYFSCAPAYESTLGNNYVFPSMGTPYHARKTIADYCPKLSHRFKLTSPRLIMAYESIDACVEEMDKDNKLEYIEDYNAGENEIVKGAYSISDGVSAIGSFAFSGCASLKSIYIPDSVTSIGKFAFLSCNSLTNINIPDSVTSIGNEAFSDCTSLTSIDIPNSVTSIGDCAFSGCTSLTNINIPDSVTSIGNETFSDCTSLANINIPGSVTNIGDFAFSDCASLTSINIPDSVTSIGDFAFSGCTSLASIAVNSSNEYYTNVDGVLYNKNKTKLIFYPINKIQTSFTIPASVKSIDVDAFSDCTLLTNINIPDSVTNIGERAFLRCTSLESISIPDSVTSIGHFAFLGCASLTNITVDSSNKHYSSVDGVLYNMDKTELIHYPVGKNQTSFTIPTSITSIGDDTFSDCNLLTNINIPDSVTSMDAGPFAYCTSLTNITVDSLNKYYTSVDGILYNKDMTELIRYPVAKKQTNFAVPSNVRTIGNHAFSDCTLLTSIDIPDSVTIIEDLAFSGCTSLANINIPDSVTIIEDLAFSGCTSLKKIHIPNSVTSIGYKAFPDTTEIIR